MVYSCNTTSNKDGKDNPFFSEFDTPEGVPPFDKIKAEHFMPAFEEAMIPYVHPYGRDEFKEEFFKGDN